MSERHHSAMKTVNPSVENATDGSTPQKTIESLQASERNYRALIDQSPVSIVVARNDMKIIYANTLALEKSQYSKKEILQLSIGDLIAPFDLERALSKWKRRDSDTNPERTFEMSILNKSGQIMISRIFYTDVVWEGTPAYLYFINDITKSRQAEEALRESKEKFRTKVEERTRELLIAKEKAEEADQLKSEFLANISHELRTPLHSILSYSRFGYENVDRKDNEKLKSFFKNIFTSGDRLMKLLNDLLDLSKLQANKMEYSIQRWSIRNLFEDMITEYSIMANDKNLTWQMQEIDDVELLFDIDKIKQVVSNLFSNAIKYANRDTVIEIEFSESPDSFQVTIRNSGPPIPESELIHIFDPFIQSSATKTGAGGTGLGLPICRKIIEDHGGKIWAEKNPNGATIIFYLKTETKQGTQNRGTLLKS